jgi:flagellar biosynthesis protein FlhF
LRIRKYIAKDLREALQMIKGDLGPEAIIISSRKVRGSGLRAVLGPSLVEVTAAVENNVDTGQQKQINEQHWAGPVDPQMPAASKKTAWKEAPAEGYWRETAKVSRHSNAVNVNQTEPVDYRELERELDELKRTLWDFTPDSQEYGTGDRSFSKIRTVLQQLELNDVIVGRLIADFRNSRLHGAETINSPDGNVNETLLQGMARLVEPFYKNIVPGRLMAFIGPTGVGKTTTLAKLAAQLALFHHKRVALLTIDTYRIGALEQLKTYSEIIGLPLEVVMTPGELKNCLRRHSDKDLILIDTAGRSLKNKEQVFELRKFIEVMPQPRDILLTLSATTKGKDLTKIVEDYRKLHFNKIIFTKIDETTELGCIVNVACQARMPVVYITDGQKVPDDIYELRPKRAAKLVLGRDK